MNDEHSKGLPNNRRQPLDFLRDRRSGDQPACTSGHLLGNGQGRAHSYPFNRRRVIWKNSRNSTVFLSYSTVENQIVGKLTVFL